MRWVTSAASRAAEPYLLRAGFQFRSSAKREEQLVGLDDAGAGIRSVRNGSGRQPRSFHTWAGTRYPAVCGSDVYINLERLASRPRSSTAFLLSTKPRRAARPMEERCSGWYCC